MTKYDILLDELSVLTDVEYSRTLTEKEKARYVQLVGILHEGNIEIPFGIEI